MSDALAGLDAIHWAALEHAYGTATDVPGLLRDLYRPEKAVDAVDELFSNVHHQGGGVYSAAPPALPYVLRAAADPAVEPVVRRELLEFVGALAYAANTSPSRFVTRTWPVAWDRAVTDLLPLLDDPATAPRIAVADTLAEAHHRADEVITALRARWTVEREQEARIRLIAAVGSLVPHADARRDGSLDWLRQLVHDADPAIRLATVQALRRALPGQDDGEDTYARTVSEVLFGSDPATWSPGGRSIKTTAVWALGLLGDDHAGRVEATGRLLAHPDPSVRAGALQAAAEMLGRRRSAVPLLLPAVARLLSDADRDPDPDNRLFAARVLGMCGPAARPWADSLADMVTDEGEPFLPAQTHAIWALSRLGDARCVPPLVRRLSGERLGFAYNSSHSEGWWTYDLSLTETAEGLGAHAELLLPALRARLATASTLDERRALCRILQSWGEAAAPAIPELIALLDTDSAVWALDALAAIGPAAARAAPMQRLRALLDAPPEGQSFAPRALALAYGRLTGDRDPALTLLLPRLGEPYGQYNPAILLGELGPAGAPYVDRLRELLPAHREGWLPLCVSEALWRITGRADEIVPVLVRAVAPFTESGGAYRAVIETVRLLGEIGPPAAPAEPFLKAFLDADERPVRHGTWRSVPEDDELCAAARTALRAITGSVPR
ncbi:hypothetical protein ACU4GG_02645 [Streptomyces nojiriensis]